MTHHILVTFQGICPQKFCIYVIYTTRQASNLHDFNNPEINIINLHYISSSMYVQMLMLSSELQYHVNLYKEPLFLRNILPASSGLRVEKVHSSKMLVSTHKLT